MMQSAIIFIQRVLLNVFIYMIEAALSPLCNFVANNKDYVAICNIYIGHSVSEPIAKIYIRVIPGA